MVVIVFRDCDFFTGFGRDGTGGNQVANMVFGNAQHGFSQILNIVIGVLDSLILVAGVVFFLTVQDFHGRFGGFFGIHNTPEDHHVQTNESPFDGAGE